MNNVLDRDKFFLISQLIREEYILFGKYLLKNGRISPYISKYKSKEELSEFTFKLISIISLSIFKNIDNFHLIGLENSGINFSKHVYDSLVSNNKKISYQSFNIKKGDQVDKKYKNIVVLDNSITTGKTLIDFKEKIFKDQKILLAVRIFNRFEIDNMHGSVDDLLLHKYGIPVFSIVNVYDLLDYLLEIGESLKWNEINDYLSVYS